MVSWQPVPAVDQNGVLTSYEVEYNQSTFPSNQTGLLMTSGPVLSLVLEGLHEYVEYSIRVRAYTVEGPGPFSEPVPFTTQEDGE